MSASLTTKPQRAPTVVTTTPLDPSIADPSVRDATAAAANRVHDYLVRCGWGTQPAAQRAERLVAQTMLRHADSFRNLGESPVDVSRLARLTLASICDLNTQQVARTVIRPVLPGCMQHPMAVRPVGPLRLQWWKEFLFGRRLSRTAA